MVFLVDLPRLPPFHHERGKTVQGPRLQGLGVGFDQAACVLPLFGHGAPGWGDYWPWGNEDREMLTEVLIALLFNFKVYVLKKCLIISTLNAKWLNEANLQVKF